MREIGGYLCLDKCNEPLKHEGAIALNTCRKFFGVTDGAFLYSDAELDSKERFCENGIELSFLKPNNIEYTQISDRFESSLSIIDVLTNCSKNEVKGFLNEFELMQ